MEWPGGGNQYPPPHIPKHGISKAFAKMKVCKAACSFGVVDEMPKVSGIAYITYLFNLIIHEGKIPSDCHKSVILNLFKI